MYLIHFSPHSSAAALFSSLFHYIMSNVSGLAASIRAATDSETFDLAGHDVSLCVHRKNFIAQSVIFIFLTVQYNMLFFLGRQY